ncbi:MAG: TldD/PmbA family protein [Actinomycetota bacterium]|jgi:PmbA protein|nr:TldD/PmbA family protein [Actinomycetota bacterium]
MNHTAATRELAARTVAMAQAAGADQSEVLAVSETSSLTRFAGNRIHQNVAEHDSQISLRAVVGTRTGVASTNRLDDDSLRSCCDAAVAIARNSPDDEAFPGLPEPTEIIAAERALQSTIDFSARDRALAAGDIIEQSRVRDLTAAGKVQTTIAAIAIANSLGIDSAMLTTATIATVLSMGTHGGSGWASFIGADASELAAIALGDRAAALAGRSAQPGVLDAGDYTVVLAPEAVGAIVQFLGWMGFSAKAMAEGRSFMSGHTGERLMSPLVTIADDALASYAMGPTFDYEGVGKTRAALVDHGVVGGPVTDSYWAARTGTANSGHALPAPSAWGPLPLNLEMAPGDSSIDELIGSVKRGVYVTRFHYVNVEDPVPVLLTGMTRDGTFLIEDGKLMRPLKNLRFTQSAVQALNNVRGVTRERRLVGTEGMASFVPGLLVDGFSDTGQTG